ncbi:transposase [Synechococcus sp. PCC 6716]|nr:transposase [Synechococcus sp. PCC 6716]
MAEPSIRSSRLATVGSLSSILQTSNCSALQRLSSPESLALLMIDDEVEQPKASSEGKAIGIDLGLIDFAVTSDGSKYRNPKHLAKHERKLKRKQRKLSRKKGELNPALEGRGFYPG